MADQNYLYSNLDFNLLSKSLPSQIPLNNDRKQSNLSHVPCKFYKQGTCTAGANCTFSHSSDLSSQAVCKFYLKGNCKFGTKCALLHTMSPFGSSSSSSTSSRFIPNQQQNYSRFIPMTPPNPSHFMDYHSLGTSAPSSEQQVWSRSYVGQSPHESSSIDYLLGTSPFSPTRTRQISSSYDSRQRQFAAESNEIPIPKQHQFDDEFQFFMDDEETLSSHPSLLSLPN